MKKYKALSFTLPIAILALLVVGLIAFLYTPTVDTPAVILATAIPNDQNSSSSVTSTNYVEVTTENVQVVIANLERAKSYSRLVTIRSFWTGGSSSTNISICVDDDKMLISQESFDTVENYLILDETLYIWYSDTEGIFETSINDEAYAVADKLIRTLTYEDALNLDTENIIDAGYTEFVGESCIYMSWQSYHMGYVYTIYVSMTSGLLMAATTYDGDTLIYEMISSAPDLSVPSASLFELPE